MPDFSNILPHMMSEIDSDSILDIIVDKNFEDLKNAIETTLIAPKTKTFENYWYLCSIQKGVQIEGFPPTSMDLSFNSSKLNAVKLTEEKLLTITYSNNLETIVHCYNHGITAPLVIILAFIECVRRGINVEHIAIVGSLNTESEILLKKCNK